MMRSTSIVGLPLLSTICRALTCLTLLEALTAMAEEGAAATELRTEKGRDLIRWVVGNEKSGVWDAGLVEKIGLERGDGVKAIVNGEIWEEKEKEREMLGGWGRGRGVVRNIKG